MASGTARLRTHRTRYSSAGTYTVVLKVTDAATNTDTETKTNYITVTAGLLADFSADKTLVALGQSVQFTNLSGGGLAPLSYQWDFGDGSPVSTAQSPSHSYSSAGTYTVVLRVTDAATNTATETKTGYITVAAGLQTDFSADKVLVAIGRGIQFSNLSAGGVAPLGYQWDFGDGSPVSTAQSPSHSYSSPGTYTVVLRVTDAATNTDNETKTNYINVCALPQADFSASTTGALLGRAITFTNLSTGGVPPLTYAWDFDGDGTIDSTDPNPTHSYAATGTYAVSLKMTDAEGNSATERRTGYISVGNAIAPHSIPPQGGIIQTADGQISVTFPEGAIAGEATLTIDILSPSTVAKVPGGFQMGGSCFTLGVVDAEGKEISMFSRQVTVTVRYSDEDVAAAGGNPENLVLAYYSEATGKWNVLETSLNTIDKTLIVTTTHLSGTWAILAKTSSDGLASWWWIVIGVAATLILGTGIWMFISVRESNQRP